MTNNEELIKLNLNKLQFKKIKLLNDKSTNQIWLIDSGGEKYILRELVNTNQKQSYLRKLYKLAIPVSTSFLNEVNVYTAFKKNKFEFFKHPNLIDTDNKSLIITEYIDHNHDTNINHLSKEKLITALLEYQTSEIFNHKKNNFEQFLVRMLRSITIEILRKSYNLTKKGYGIKTSLKCLRILFYSNIMINKNIKPINIHGDLGFKRNGEINNTIIGKNKELYFFDFESATREKKWIFVDIVDICWNENFIDTDIERLNLYLKYFKKYYSIKNSDIKIQVRVALLRRSLRMLCSPSVKLDEKLKWEKFLSSCLLDNDFFEQWYNENISTKLL